MRLILQLGIYAFHVMIVGKTVEFHPAGMIQSHVVDAFHRVCDLEIIVVIVTGVESLVQIIIRNRVQRLTIHPTSVIAVNHLTHQPEPGLNLICQTTQCLHETEIQHVRCVQTETVNVKFRYPHADSIAQIVLHSAILLVQLHQKIISSPVFIGKSVVILVIPLKIDVAEPIAVRRVLPVPLQILKGKKIPSYMVEHAIQNDPDPLPVTFCHKVFQILVRSQTTVQVPVICRVVPMGSRLEQGADVERVAPQTFDVFDPWQQGVQPMNRLPVIILLRCAGKPQRINMIKYGIVIPCHSNRLPNV